ncbi:MAG: ECF transporter S component [Oscillospiraceae bacterium]|nr:ECF transporter S component [Oscillospiraceae bacterium]
MKNRKVIFMAQFAILAAIEAIVCFTPLGSIPIPGLVVATLSHIPVIVAAIMLGTWAGAGMGFLFGLFSFLIWSFAPPSPVLAFVFTPLYSFGDFSGNFWSILICFAPRVLIGVVAGLTYGFLSKRSVNRVFVCGLSGVLATLTNTFLVLGGIYVFFGRNYAMAIGEPFGVLLGMMGMVVLTNGIPEAIIGGIAGTVCVPLKKALKQ